MFPIDIAFDGLSGVDGSARFSFGATTAIASVSGPIAPRLAIEHPVRASIDVHVRPLTSVSSTPEKHTALVLKGILERVCVLTQHPRTAIQVVVQALSPSSPHKGPDAEATDLLAAAQINAASLALLNAGSVPMRGVVCAVAVAQPDADADTLPRLVGGSSRARDDTSPVYTGCFAFLFGVDGGVEGTCGDESVPPSKMIWTNYRACPGHAFSATALAQAEQVALGGAMRVWVKMKASLGTSAFGCGL